MGQHTIANFHMLCQDSEVDAEDLFGSEKDSDSEMAITQELPGKGDEEEPVASPNSNHEGVSGDEGGSRSDEDSNDESTEKVPKGKDSSKGSCPDMRSLYWSVIHEEQKKIKKSNPEMPGREVLKLARKASLVIESTKTNLI